MKNIVPILLIATITIGGCMKDKAVQPSTQRSLPYENNNLKMELVSSTVPAANDMHFINENIGIISTYDGKIYKSIDQGKTWILKYTDPTPDRPLTTILFVDENVGYVAGGEGWCSQNGCIPPGAVLLKTSDAGETWGIIFQIDGAGEFSSVASNSKGDLFLVENKYSPSPNAESLILRSSDGGMNWTAIATFNVSLRKIVFSNKNGFCIGGSAEVTRSIDDGNTWNHTTSFDAGWISDIAFNNNTGYCISSNRTVYKTTDNGESWGSAYSSPSDYFYKVAPLSDHSCLIWSAVPNTGGCFGSDTGSVNQSINAGNTWQSVQFKDISSVWESSFYSSNEGYVLSGEYGGSKLIKVAVQ